MLSPGLVTWLPVLGLPLSAWLLRRSGVLRADAFAGGRGRELPPVPWLLWVVCGVVIFCSMIFGAATALAMAGIAGPDPGEAPESARTRGIAALGAYLVAGSAAIALVVFMRKWFRHGEGAPRWLGARPSDALLGLVALAAALPFVQAVNVACVVLYRLVTSRTPPEVAHETLEAMRAAPGDPWVWVQLGAAVLGAPIVEEVLYRVMLQTAILQATGRAWWAIAGSSVVFGLSHAGAVEWYAMPTLIVLGAALGVAYERTKSLGVPIVMHIAFNALNVWLAAVL